MDIRVLQIPLARPITPIGNITQTSCMGRMLRHLQVHIHSSIIKILNNLIGHLFSSTRIIPTTTLNSTPIINLIGITGKIKISQMFIYPLIKRLKKTLCSKIFKLYCSYCNQWGTCILVSKSSLLNKRSGWQIFSHSNAAESKRAIFGSSSSRIW